MELRGRRSLLRDALEIRFGTHRGGLIKALGGGNDRTKLAALYKMALRCLSLEASAGDLQIRPFFVARRSKAASRMGKSCAVAGLRG